jgi:hypothetical protein
VYEVCSHRVLLSCPLQSPNKLLIHCYMDSAVMKTTGSVGPVAEQAEQETPPALQLQSCMAMLLSAVPTDASMMSRAFCAKNCTTASDPTCQNHKSLLKAIKRSSQHAQITPAPKISSDDE